MKNLILTIIELGWDLSSSRILGWSVLPAFKDHLVIVFIGGREGAQQNLLSCESR